MKNPNIILSSGKLKVIDAPEPYNEKLYSGDQWKEAQMRKEYDTALRQAIKEGIDVDERSSIDFFWNAYQIGTLSSDITKQRPEENVPYPLPEGYRVDLVDAKVARVLATNGEHKKMPLTGQVAYLVPVDKEIDDLFNSLNAEKLTKVVKGDVPVEEKKGFNNGGQIPAYGNEKPDPKPVEQNDLYTFILKRKQQYHKDCLKDQFINGRFWECQEILEYLKSQPVQGTHINDCEFFQVIDISVYACEHDHILIDDVEYVPIKSYPKVKPVEQFKTLEDFLESRIRDSFKAIEGELVRESYPFDGKSLEELQGMKRAYSDVLTTLPQYKAASIQKEEWISVEERLPEDGQRVLAWGKGGRCVTAIWKEHDPIGSFLAYSFFSEELETAEEITHWINLPSPPKHPDKQRPGE